MFDHKTEKARIGARLRVVRERAHITVEDAASAAGVQPLAVTKWERGAAQPSLVELRALMEAYGCMACDILYEENPWRLTTEESAELGRAVRGSSQRLRARVDLFLTMHTKGVEPVWKAN